MYYKLVRHARRQLFYVNKLVHSKSLKRMSAPMMNSVKTKPRHRLEETSKTRPEQIDVKQPYLQLARTVDHGRTGDALRNRGMCLPPPLVQPSIINRHPQPRVASDPRNIRPLTYENRRQVQNETPRHSLEDAGTSNARPERIYDTSFRKEASQPRLDAIKRGMSKRRRPPATIYPRDKDY